MFAQIDKVFSGKAACCDAVRGADDRRLAQILNREAPRSRWSSLVTIQPKGRVAIFLHARRGRKRFDLPGAFKHLGTDQPFYGLQSQGLDGSVAPQSRIETWPRRTCRKFTEYSQKGHISWVILPGRNDRIRSGTAIEDAGPRGGAAAMFDTLNWYKLPPLTFWKKTRVNVERVIFHALNFLRLDSDGRSKFFGEKVQAVRNRILFGGECC